MPSQEMYDSLSDTSKRHVVAISQRFIYGLATAILVLFGILQAATYDVATRSMEALPMYWMAVLGAFLVGTLAGCVWLMVAMKQTVSRLWREEKDG